MAEEIRLDLKVETGDSNIRIGELTESIEQLKQNIENINFEMVSESFTNFTNTVEEGLKSSVTTAELFANKSLEIQDILAEKTLEKDKVLAGARIDIAHSVAGSLSSLGEILIKNEEKAAKFQKAIAITRLAIDTAVAIAGAIRQAATNPANLLPPLLIADIETRIGIILANIAKAKRLLSKAKGPSAPSLTVPTGGGGGGIGGGRIPTEGPRLGQIGRTRLNPDGTIQEEPKIPPIKTFVVETEMTDAQKKIKRLRDNVTFE